MLFKLALRNVFRYKRRTVITFSTISLGLGLMAIGMSLYNGVDKQSMNNIVDSQTGHLKIFAEGYFEKKDDLPLELTIDNPQKIKALLRNNNEIQGTESRILFMATLIKGLDEIPCIGVGVEPESDPLVFNIKESLKEGSYLEPSDQKVLVGSNLAKDLGLYVGEEIVIRMFSSTEDYVWNAMDLEIKGIVDTSNPMVNSQNIFIPLALAQESLSLGGKATEITIRLKEDTQIPTVQSSIQEILSPLEGNYEVFSFNELESGYNEVLRMKSRIQAIIPLIMLLIASLGIINTMLMAVLERTREIGMMAAMGMRKLEVLRLFIYEGALIGFFGSLTGCFLGAIGGWYLEVKGMSLSSFGEEMINILETSFPIKDVFYGDLTLGILLFTLVFGTVVAILASIYPAYKAVRVEPIRALRHV
jgi:putative ABC transport system permease protein